MRLTRLRELRQRAFLTQVELGEKAGISEATINRLEQGKHDARISTVRKLAEVLGVSPSELVGQESADTKRAA
jgi:transcriptional regulator with XRE-family HTH domain